MFNQYHVVAFTDLHKFDHGYVCDYKRRRAHTPGDRNLYIVVNNYADAPADCGSHCHRVGWDEVLSNETPGLFQVLVEISIAMVFDHTHTQAAS